MLVVTCSKIENNLPSVTCWWHCCDCPTLWPHNHFLVVAREITLARLTDSYLTVWRYRYLPDVPVAELPVDNSMTWMLLNSCRVSQIWMHYHRKNIVVCPRSSATATAGPAILPSRQVAPHTGKNLLPVRANSCLLEKSLFVKIFKYQGIHVLA